MSAKIPEDRLALDRSSARAIDKDGHLHVGLTTVSAANVSPYLGREVADFEKLGLDPDRTYRLYRAADELAKAATSFNGKPVLSTHKPQTADQHDADLVIGSINNVVFDAPYLKGDLTIWNGEAIAEIMSGVKKELSSGYRYTADMTEGSINGEAYDGVMRDICFNHLALVVEGRVPGAFVADSAPPKSSPSPKQKEMDMPKVVLKGSAAAARVAIMAAIVPKLAVDAKFDPAPLLAKVTAANFKASRPALIKGVLAQAKFAQDASIDTDDLEKILDVVEAISPDEDEAVVSDEDGDLDSFLKSKGMSDAEIAKVKSMMAAPAADEDMNEDEDMDDDKKKKAVMAAKDKQAKDADKDDKKDTVTKPAMDAAIAVAVRKATETANQNQREIRDAEREVRAHVGDLAMAHDSAAGVYRTALVTMGEDEAEIADLPLNALKAILKRVPVPGAKKPVRMASDAAAEKGFSERYPDASRIRAL